MRLGSTIAFVLALAGLALAIVALVGVDPNALCVLPALALAAPLLMRRYPGERVLGDMSGARRRRWPPPLARTPRLGRLFSIAPHGGQLIARSLAVRPPPARLPAS